MIQDLLQNMSPLPRHSVPNMICKRWSVFTGSTLICPSTVSVKRIAKMYMIIASRTMDQTKAYAVPKSFELRLN